MIRSPQTRHKKIPCHGGSAGRQGEALGIEKFAEVIKTTPITRRTMLLFTTSIDVLKAVEGGVPITELNIGGMPVSGRAERLTKALVRLAGGQKRFSGAP